MKGIDEMDNAELLAFVDDHLLMALIASERLSYSRQAGEDYLRDRIVAVSDSFPTLEAAEKEDSRRRMLRLGRAIGLTPQGLARIGETTPPPKEKT